MGIHRHAVTFATCYRLHSCNMQLVLSGTVPRCCAWANTGNSLGKDSKAGAAGTSPAFYSFACVLSKVWFGGLSCLIRVPDLHQAPAEETSKSVAKGGFGPGSIMKKVLLPRQARVENGH